MPGPNDFKLPGQTSQYLPPELNEEFFASLDESMQRGEKVQMERTLEDFNRRGILQSGQTLKGVAEDVIGPSIQRRTQALLPLAREGAMAGREERLGEVAFERQRQFAKEEFDRRLIELQRKAELDRELMELQHSLADTGGFGFGDFVGQAVGIGIGAYTGGIGAGLGARAGSSLFGGKAKTQG